MRTEAVIREMTTDDFVRQYGGLPPFPFLGLIMIDTEGDILCLGGVFAGDMLISFSRVNDKCRPYPRNILDMAKAMRSVLGSFDENVYALASPTEKNPGGFMEYIGFRYVATVDDGDYYVWENKND